jgi:hypothetical protein
VNAWLYGGLGGAVLVLAGLLWWRSGQLDQVNADFTAYKATQEQLLKDTVRQNALDVEETRIRNETMSNALHTELAASIAGGTRTAVQLRDALARNATRTVSETPDQSGAAPASGVSGSIAEITDATGQALAAGTRDAARLNTLVAEIKPQL